MPSQQRRPQQSTPASKKSAQTASKNQPSRPAPAPLDEKALRQVAGGVTNAPHGVW